MEKNDEDIHLEEEHRLVKKTVYVRDNKKQRSSNAECVARHRQKKKEQGLVTVEVPQIAADAFRAAGSFTAWYKTHVIPEKQLAKQRAALRFVEKFPEFIQGLIFHSGNFADVM